MTPSNKKLVILVVLFGLAVGLWHKRSVDFDNANRAPTPPVPARPPAAEVLPGSTVADGTAPVLATIAWARPENPSAIPASNRSGDFLVDTKEGIRLWHANNGSFETLQPPLADVRLMDETWMRVHSGVHNGTLFAVGDGKSASLILLPFGKTQIADQMTLPVGFVPTRLVRLSQDTALVCSSRSGPPLFITMGTNKIRQLKVFESRMFLAQMIKDAGIVGQIDGLGTLGDPGMTGDPSYERPVLFDINRCEWKLNRLPEPLASAEKLEVMLKKLAPFGWFPSLISASWFDRSANQSRTLEATLVWESDAKQWRARQVADYPILPPDQMLGMAEEEWSFAADVSQGKFAFLAAYDDRWRESIQRLPSAEGLKLLPIDRESVLALLIDSRQPGRVVRLDPVSSAQLTQKLPALHSHSSAIASLTGGGVLLANGRNVNYMMIARPNEPNLEKLPNFPQPAQHLSGFELADGSLVVFGGLHPDCYPGSLERCQFATHPSFRWIPAEKRWQPLPTLAVPFDFGEPLEGGNAGFATRHARSDFVVHHGSDLYFLSGRSLTPGKRPLWGATQLYRWSLDGGLQKLQATRKNRINPTLIELNDGRLAVVGGSAKDEEPTGACQDCKNALKLTQIRRQQPAGQGQGMRTGEEDDPALDPAQFDPALACDPCKTFLRLDNYSATRSSETYFPSSNRWADGPASHHPGGRAAKLANGRIFKFGLLGHYASDATYAAETADASLKKWTAAPPFPLGRSTEVIQFFVIGNKVVFVMASPADKVVIWDDDLRSWQTLPLPKHSEWGLRYQPRSISAVDRGRVLVIYEGSYELLPWPFN